MLIHTFRDDKVGALPFFDALNVGSPPRNIRGPGSGINESGVQTRPAAQPAGFKERGGISLASCDIGAKSREGSDWLRCPESR